MKTLEKIIKSDKFKCVVGGILVIPMFVGVIVTLTWMRKFMTDFWAALFF